MKIGLRGGHSPNCKGAIGYVDEQIEVRIIYEYLKPLLERQGHEVINCNSNSSTVKGELSDGTNRANYYNVDLYITIHMNAYNGQAHGSEVWLYPEHKHWIADKAHKILNELQDLGFTNRGIKTSKNLHDLRASAAPAMIIETLFCDNKGDTDIYSRNGARGIATAIAKAFGSVVSAVPKWHKDNKGWWYKTADGNYLKNCWKYLDAWYYFGSDGYAYTGWQKVGGDWYFFDENCRMMSDYKFTGCEVIIGKNGEVVAIY